MGEEGEDGEVEVLFLYLKGEGGRGLVLLGRMVRFRFGTHLAGGISFGNSDPDIRD